MRWTWSRCDGPALLPPISDFSAKKTRQFFPANATVCQDYHSLLALHQRQKLPLQKAATRACRNAIEFNSLPAMGRLIPSGYAGMRLHIKIGTPHPVRLYTKHHLHAAGIVDKRVQSN